MNDFPTIYLTVVVILILILSYILTKQLLDIYLQNKSLSTLTSSKSKGVDENYAVSQIYWYKKMYLDALVYSKIILQNPNDYTPLQLSQIYQQIGNLYILLDYYDKAITQYQLSVTALPNSEDSMLKLAYLFKKTNQYKLAIQVYQQILEYYPNNTLAQKEISKLAYFN